MNIICQIFLFFLLVYGNVGFSQSFNELKRVGNPNVGPNDNFGNSVSLYDSIGVIGSPSESITFSNEGAVYIITQNQGGINNWGEVKKITPSDNHQDKVFGVSVAIYNDYLVVGSTGDNTNGLGSGAAYVFKKDEGGYNNWGQVAKLFPSDGDSLDIFGISVSIYESYIAVGAHCNRDSGECTGSAYIYYKNQGGVDNWGEVKKVMASDGSETDYFGGVVKIDSSVLVVGANEKEGLIGNAPTGSAYVFYKNEGGIDNWGQIKKIVPLDIDTNDFFGSSICLQNDTVIIGAPGKNDGVFIQSGAAYMFAKNEGGINNWGEFQKLSPINPDTSKLFGSSVAIYNEFVLVGAQGDNTNGNQSGSIFLYNNIINWPFSKQLFTNDIATNDNLANSISLFGNFALVGAKYKSDSALNAGAAYVFIENSLPILEGLSDTSVCENQSITLPFRVLDKETSASGLVVNYLASSNTNIVNASNVNIGGVDSNRNITIVPETNKVGQTFISIVLIDTLNGTDTVTFLLVVNGLDSVVENKTICAGDSVFFGGNYIELEGQYTHTYLNENLCDSVVTLNLIVDSTMANIVISSSYSEICKDNNVLFTSTINNGGVSPQYEWFVNNISSGSGFDFQTSTLNNLDSVYCVFTSSLLCANQNKDTSNKIVIIVNTVFKDTVYDTICNGEVYESQTGNIYDSAGFYVDSFSSVQGCDSVVCLELTFLPNDTVYFVDTICEGDSLLFGNTFYKVSGNYQNISQNDYGCDSLSDLVLFVEPMTLSVNIFALDTNVCRDDSVSLYPVLNGGGKNTTYLWKRNSQIVSTDSNYVFPTSLISSGDVFTCEVISSSICFSNQLAVSGTLKLRIRNNTETIVYDTVCSGLPYQFGSQNLTTSGTYSDTSLASVWCDSITTLHLVVYPVPSTPNIIQVGDTMFADSGYVTYQWIYNGTDITGETDINHVGSQSGIYRVEVTDSNGCMIVSYPWNYSPVGIDDYITINNVVFYPNPFNSWIKITSNNSILVSIYSITGNILFRNNVLGDEIIDTDSFEPGIYFIEMNNKNGKTVQKLIKNE